MVTQVRLKLISKLLSKDLQDAILHLYHSQNGKFEACKCIDKKDKYYSIDLFTDNQRIHTYYENSKHLKHDYKILKLIIE
jgi:hypothetical protein